MFGRTREITEKSTEIIINNQHTRQTTAVYKGETWGNIEKKTRKVADTP